MHRRSFYAISMYYLLLLIFNFEYMKRLLSVVAALFIAQSSFAQITITAGDMPVSGDTLRYSIASPVGAMINPGDTGANFAWNYALTPTAQAVDTYQSAMSVNLTYVLTIGLTAYGYRVANALPGPVGMLLPVPITDVYTFFEKKSGPSRFEAKAFAANIAGLPTPINYTSPDVWYFFPLDYMNVDSSQFELNIVIPTLGGIKQKGVRHTRVDGWGTITTPYYTTPANCIRVRSVIHEIDSISLPLGTFGVPRNTVEYKWLVNGEHYPALWVTSNIVGGVETINSIRYRDVYRDTTSVIPPDTTNAVHTVTNAITAIKAYPNPAINGHVTLELPTYWKTFSLEVFDIQSKAMAVYQNEREIDIASLPSGVYIVRIISGNNVGYAQIVK
jgi:Secretion system C-terminal sorting domain